ncbi:MAG TPA: glycosyltransferase [Usitatibacter sp.]|nr:glycosyltransferase [Usitatibacter sp.]
MTNPPDELRYGLDRLIATGKRIFGWGWVAHSTRRATDVHLCVEGDGWTRRLQADFGLARRDVQESFPHLRDAASSGFIVTGFLPEGTRRALKLQVQFDDGATAEIDVAGVVQARHARRRRWRQLAYLARAVWRRLKHGDFTGIVRRAKAQSYAATTLDDWGIVEELVPSLRAYPQTWLVFDHTMGGGANQYRRALIAERLAAGDAAVFCTYNLPMLEYRLHVHLPGHEERVFRISTFLVLEPLLHELAAVQVFVNSPVSFEEPLVLAEWLASMKAQHPKARLTITTHDYFMACPSFVLLDANGRHCGVPATTQCEACLRKHEASYVSLSPPSEIPVWRRSWGRCLAAADEVRCFSEASRRLLLRAYPALPQERVTLVPHRSDFVPSRVPRIDASAPLVIGIVGEISPQKGAGIVTGMVEIIEREHRDARIVVIGTLDAACSSPRLKVTGRYQRADLPDLIESNAINVFLFSSIWPETFSYVVAELMALAVPVVGFDLGAPAERLATYPMGRLCGEVSAKAALDTLTQFHAELAKAQLARVA